MKLWRNIDCPSSRYALKFGRQKSPGETKRYACIKDIVNQVCENVKYCLAWSLACAGSGISVNFQPCASEEKWVSDKLI